jgi:zinc transporter 9
LDAQNDARAMRAVNVAVQANTLIFFTKLGAYGMTGSSVMLAEAVHSAADILNQSLLFMGIRSSAKAPDENYNYGYRRERFVWSLISAVGVFFAGSGVSVAHGVHTLLNPTPVEHAFVGIGVLAASAAIDAYSLRVAYVALRENAEARNMSLAEFIHAGHDPTSVAVVAEDAAAVAGCGVAAAALFAAHVTGDAAYDAFGSIAVGGLLGLTATYLINSNRLLLLGRSLGDEKMRRVTDAIRSDPVVTEVYRAKSEELGPGSYRFVAEIEFSGAKVVERYLQSGEGAKRRQLHAMFRDAAKEMERVKEKSGKDASGEYSDAYSDPKACASMDAALRLYGEEVVTAVGDEVDRMEKTIVGVEPTIHYVDLETN